MNNGVAQELCSMRYVTDDNAIEKVLWLGADSLLAKMDVPIHPSDQRLLGMMWEGLYIDTVSSLCLKCSLP